MMRATMLPTARFHVKPAFWGFDRDLRQVMDELETTWLGTNSFANFTETDDAFFYTLDVPGVNKKNLELNIEDDRIHLKAERKLPNSDEAINTMTKVISIPKHIDREKIEAHCEDGVLYLTFPKLEKMKSKKIEVTDKTKNASWRKLLGQGEKTQG